MKVKWNIFIGFLVFIFLGCVSKPTTDEDSKPKKSNGSRRRIAESSPRRKEPTTSVHSSQGSERSEVAQEDDLPKSPRPVPEDDSSKSPPEPPNPILESPTTISEPSKTLEPSRRARKRSHPLVGISVNGSGDTLDALIRGHNKRRTLGVEKGKNKICPIYADFKDLTEKDLVRNFVPDPRGEFTEKRVKGTYRYWIILDLTLQEFTPKVLYKDNHCVYLIKNLEIARLIPTNSEVYNRW